MTALLVRCDDQNKCLFVFTYIRVDITKLLLFSTFIKTKLERNVFQTIGISYVEERRVLSYSSCSVLLHSFLQGFNQVVQHHVMSFPIPTHSLFFFTPIDPT